MKYDPSYYKKYYDNNKDTIRRKKREWYHANKNKVKQSKEKNKKQIIDRARKALYGFSSIEYDALYIEQKGLCAICRKPERIITNAGKLKALSIDHCHVSNEVRGLLCDRCNRGLGFFGDDPARLIRAYQYITRTE